MANFGIAHELLVTSESAVHPERTSCRAQRDTLSASEDCIQITKEEATGQPGTIVVAKIQPQTSVDVDEAVEYITEFVRYLSVPVMVNGEIVSLHNLDESVTRPAPGWQYDEKDAVVGPQTKADVELVVAAGTGDVWIKLANINLGGRPTGGTMVLRQGLYQIRTFRSRFALANAAVRTSYGLGGIANLSALEPTAGREAITTSSLQLLQTIITECENYVSQKISATELINLNTGFMSWVAQSSRFDLCSKLTVRVEPNSQAMALDDVRLSTKTQPMNFFEGSDPATIEQFGTDEQPLIVLAARQPRRKCELGYLNAYCHLHRVVNAPTVLNRKPESSWTLAESAVAFRFVGILESDYFVKVTVEYGEISHGLSLFVDTSKDPIQIVLDMDSPTIVTMLQLYEADFASLTGMVKDYVRTAIFPKLSKFVPSSTRQGAEAFLRAIRRPRDVFEYEKAELGSLADIWQDYLQGKIPLSVAARQSTAIVRTSVQVVDRSAARPVAEVLPDVLENERILAKDQPTNIDEEMIALPAITRLDIVSPAKLLTIDTEEEPLKGFRCFLAITDRVRRDRGEFFLQPHRTEIVWGGQKVLFIFPHHSEEFGLYYELQGNEILSAEPGGRGFPTCTIALKDQIYIPIPEEIASKFLPGEGEKKRFEVRCDLLYPESSPNGKDKTQS